MTFPTSAWTRSSSGAQALAGQLVILAVVIAFLVELALGNYGAPYDWLAAIGGFTYLGAYLYGVRR